jgi:sirohydrochlorin cobaltochelatase
VIVFPYFLFSGILIDRIYGFTDKCADKYPEIQFQKAGYLGDHPKVLETFAERITEQMGGGVPNCGTCMYRTQIINIEDGEHKHVTPEQRMGKDHPALSAVPPAPCVMCKYRAQVLGFEHEVGAVQESHHHHVEGQGASAPGSNVEDCKMCDTYCTGECRLDMDHHHHHDHDHSHDHDHGHHHHHHDHVHAEYPQAKHPLGPESARKT